MHCNYYFDNIPDINEENTPICTVNSVEADDITYHYEPTEDVINKYCSCENFVNCPRFVNRD
jgi:hypothetical protein